MRVLELATSYERATCFREACYNVNRISQSSRLFILLKDKMEYRQLYCNYYNIIISQNYDIHHIDLNHGNNDISNLLLLPKELHRRLHQAYLEFIKCKNSFTLDDITLYSGNVNSKSYFIDCLHTYLDVLEECKIWMNYKELGYAAVKDIISQ